MRKLMLLAAMLAMVMIATVPAFAQGQVERGPEHANSICSYSGLNDFSEGPGPRTQSYGQEVKAGFLKPSEVKSGFPSPGFFCNAHNFPLQEMQ